MKILEFPHATSDYTCPVSGLVDIYESVNNKRINEYLILGFQMGFAMITSNLHDPKKMIFLGNGIGQKLFTFFQPIMNYSIHFSEKCCFKNTIKKAINLIDQGIPVILFGLDMFYLPYHHHFYHQVHIEGHVVMMVGYDDDKVYVYDNSVSEMVTIPLSDLEKAWENDYVGVCKKFTFFGIEMKEKTDKKEVIIQALHKSADQFFNPQVNFLGIKGYDLLIKQITSWNYTYEEYESIFKSFIFFSSGVIPSLPKCLDSSAADLGNQYDGGKAKLANIMKEELYSCGIENGSLIKEALKQSANTIRKINDLMIKDCLNHQVSDMKVYQQLFKDLKESEVQTFNYFLQAK